MSFAFVICGGTICVLLHLSLYPSVCQSVYVSASSHCVCMPKESLRTYVLCQCTCPCTPCPHPVVRVERSEEAHISKNEDRENYGGVKNDHDKPRLPVLANLQQEHRGLVSSIGGLVSSIEVQLVARGPPRSGSRCCRVDL